MNLTGLYDYKRIIIYWHIFHHICGIKYKLDCRYSPQNIFNAKNFNPHKKPISLLNVHICIQGMQRTCWPEAGTITVTGPHSWIGFGDNTCLLWWNKVNNQFCQLTTRVSYQRGIRWPFKCTGNHTYWGLKNNWSMQSKNGLQNLWGNTVFFIPC